MYTTELCRISRREKEIKKKQKKKIKFFFDVFEISGKRVGRQNETENGGMTAKTRFKQRDRQRDKMTERYNQKVRRRWEDRERRREERKYKIDVHESGGPGYGPFSLIRSIHLVHF